MTKRGQSFIEYILIAVLVILGVVIMGPYVLRSINAHYMMWDEGVQDSYTENIVQAPVNAVQNINTNCVCTPPTQQACGSPCAPTQKEYTYNCTPLGCNGSPNNYYCQDDSSCCTGWQGIGCGTFPCPQGGCPTQQTEPAQGNNCYYGYEIMAETCGQGNSITCQLNSSCPLPMCLGMQSQYATICPGSADTSPPLLQNAGTSFVANVASCSPAPTPPCQYYCSKDAQLLNGQCVPCTTVTIHERTGGDEGHYCEPDRNGYGNACCDYGIHGAQDAFCLPGYSGVNTEMAQQDAAFVCLSNGFSYMTGYQVSGGNSDGCAGCARGIEFMTPDQNVNGTENLSTINNNGPATFYAQGFTRDTGAAAVTSVTCSTCPAN